MCECGLGEDLHWYTDDIHAMGLFEVARSPEQAEHSLRTWAAKVVRKGHVYLDIRSTAAKLLATRRLNMQAVCSRPELLALMTDCCTMYE